RLSISPGGPVTPDSGPVDQPPRSTRCANFRHESPPIRLYGLAQRLGAAFKASVGEPGGLQRARPAVELALAPQRQQLRQVCQAQLWVGRAHFGDEPPALLSPAGEHVACCCNPAGGEIIRTGSQGGRRRIRRVVVSPNKEECVGACG